MFSSKDKLPQAIETALRKEFRIKSLFAIQDLTLDHLHNCAVQEHCSDICLSSPTGSGKTLCYALPIAKYLGKRFQYYVQAVVLLPTKDLANQTYHVFIKLCASLPIRVALINGFHPLEDEGVLLSGHSEHPYQGVSSKKIKNHPDHHKLWNRVNANFHAHIVIATPQRLQEHLEIIPDLLRRTRFLVFDEADALLSFSNALALHDIVKSTNRLPLAPPLHKVFCSATFNVQLAYEFNIYPVNPFMLDSPLCTSTLRTGIHKQSDAPARCNYEKMEPRTPCSMEPTENITSKKENFDDVHVRDSLDLVLPPELIEHFIETDEDVKINTLCSLLLVLKCEQQHFESDSRIERKETHFAPLAAGDLLIVFCSSRRRSHRLHCLLRIFGFASCEFSHRTSNRDRGKQHSLLSADKFQIVLTTDLLSRGIDFDQRVLYVVHYDVPTDAKTYLHRCGRTARAFRSGFSITLVDSAGVEFLQQLRSLLLPRRPIIMQNIPDLHDTFSIALSKAMNYMADILRQEEEHVSDRSSRSWSTVPLVDIMSGETYDRTTHRHITSAFPLRETRDHDSVEWAEDVHSNATDQKYAGLPWICELCKYTNLPLNTSCHRCRTLKSFYSKEYRGSLTDIEHGGMWKCRECGMRHQPRALMCDNCQRRRHRNDPVLFTITANRKGFTKEEHA